MPRIENDFLGKYLVLVRGKCKFGFRIGLLYLREMEIKTPNADTIVLLPDEQR